MHEQWFDAHVLLTERQAHACDWMRLSGHYTHYAGGQQRAVMMVQGINTESSKLGVCRDLAGDATGLGAHR